MHPKNIHKTSYNFDELIKVHPELASFCFVNKFDTKTIDFSNQQAVLQLNKALLKYHYQLTDWNIPEGYLCPPIPGRADYIHHLADLLSEKSTNNTIKGLDIGVGANCIYPILGHRIYNWDMVGADSSPIAVNAAKKNIIATSGLSNSITIRQQTDNAYIFKNIIQPSEYFDFTMCNPPFHKSAEEAHKGTTRKLQNLKINSNHTLNFGGQANELWCNGGEALFIKRMIKESVLFKNQVTWFTCLVAKKEHLPKIHKQLDKLNATYKTIAMNQGNKQSRFVAWKF